MPIPDNQDLVPIRRVMEETGFGRNTFQRAIRTGELKGKKEGQVWLVEYPIPARWFELHPKAGARMKRAPEKRAAEGAPVDFDAEITRLEAQIQILRFLRDKG